MGILQHYLNEGLITFQDDTQFEKLKKVSTELQKKILKSDSNKILSYTLAAIDPKISAANPEIIEVKELVIKHWNTFASNAKDTPITYIRAALLEALETTITQNVSFAGSIWFGARNAINHFNLSTSERKLLDNFLYTLGNRINDLAIEEWKVKKGDFTKYKIAANESTAITSVNNQVNKLLEESEKIYTILQLKSELIWWKESKYSESLKQSYLVLNKEILFIVLAKDCADYIPLIHPSSVDYFLQEVLSQFFKTEKKIKLSEILTFIEKDADMLKSILNEPKAESSRISLLTFISGLVSGKFKTENLEPLTGINSEIELNNKDLVLWMFHDFQSAKPLNK